VDAESAVGSGYSEAKWVVEAVLRAAAQSTALRPTIVRLDQLSGSSANGSWNQTDSIPAIVRSGQVLGCLPDRRDVSRCFDPTITLVDVVRFSKNIAWLPVDVAAASIIELRGSKAPYLHLRNPHPIPWHQVFKAVSAQLTVSLVPYAEWLSRLAAQSESLESGSSDVARGVRNNPAMLLLDFFRSIGENRGPMVPLMDISEAMQRCTSLGSAELETAMSEEEVKKWISYWKRKGLLE
jgi:thioester reductase-like protein